MCFAANSIICILLDIPCYQNQEEKKITECGNKASPRKAIVEWILSAWNDISCETFRKSFKSCALTTALDAGMKMTKSIASSPNKIHS